MCENFDTEQLLLEPGENKSQAEWPASLSAMHQEVLVHLGDRLSVFLLELSG